MLSLTSTRKISISAIIALISLRGIEAAWDDYGVNSARRPPVLEDVEGRRWHGGVFSIWGLFVWLSLLA